MANECSLDTQIDRVEQLLRSPLVVPVVGACVAQSAGLPGSSELAKRLLATSAHAPTYSSSPESLAAVVDFLALMDGASPPC